MEDGVIYMWGCKGLVQPDHGLLQRQQSKKQISSDLGNGKFFFASFVEAQTWSALPVKTFRTKLVLSCSFLQ